MAIESRGDVVKLVTDLDLLLTMSLEVLENGRVDQIGGTVVSHFEVRWVECEESKFFN